MVKDYAVILAAKDSKGTLVGYRELKEHVSGEEASFQIMKLEHLDNDVEIVKKALNTALESVDATSEEGQKMVELLLNLERN